MTLDVHETFEAGIFHFYIVLKLWLNMSICSYKGPGNIYGNTGPENEQWPLVKLTMAPLIWLHKIEHVSAW